MRIFRDIVLAAALCASAASAAYTPVSPAIPFGETETVASVYGDANYYTHWIDNTHPSATDAGNPTGTPTTPRATIPDLSNLAAGSVVQIRGGPYTGTSLAIGGAGTTESPIFITGGTAYSGAEIRRPAVIGAATTSNLIIEGLAWTTVDEDCLLVRPVVNQAYTFDNIVVRDCELTGNGVDTSNGAAIAAGRFTADTTTGYLTDIVFLRLRIHDFGLWSIDTENDKHGINTGRYCNRVWIKSCEIYRVGGDAVQSSHAADHTGPNLFIIGNTFYNCGENGVDTKEINGVIIENNEMYDMGTIDAGQAIVVHYGPTSGDGGYDVWILSNYLHDTPIGMSFSDNRPDGPIWVIGNLMTGLTSTGISYSSTSGGDYRVFNNTIDGTLDGTDLVDGFRWSASSVDGFESRNNIVINVSDDHYEFSGGVDNVGTVTHELAYQGGGNVSIVWAATTYTSVAAWISGTTAGDNSLQVDPEFVGAGNYTPTAESPVIGVGYNWLGDAQTDFNSSFGIASAAFNDRNGVVYDTTPDIGAFQNSGGSSPDAPTSPTATATSGTSITVGWTDNDDDPDETSFRIERSLTTSTGFSEVGTAAANVTSYVDDNLTPGTTYYYRIRARNAGGDSAYTSEASDTTDAIAAVSASSNSGPIMHRR